MVDVTKHEELVYKARLAEQAERYDEMSEFMKEVVMMTKKLSTDERNLLSVAFKNAVGARRAAYRVILSTEQKQEKRQAEALVKIAREYRQKVDKELRDICASVLDIVDSHLVKDIPETKEYAEPNVFYHKMKGDYYRYLCEFNPETSQEQIQKARESYEKATKLAVDLPSTHAIRLGLALNFSVFHYEILLSPAEACQMAQHAFDEAIAELDNVSEDTYRDSTLIMQLLRDNLTLWFSDGNKKTDAPAEEDH
ncbi:MAG: uncharacterized protein KVP18_000615 [Porospora cf. gigantea A]|uniref:uncharacterized protein n=1 Tax=Porospora cf. gigantea A TaxID=2853593 RepID=UPI00355A15C2|nr:MAG: hypothetical protein KVP18_000615 [Porospora cf. gigantea A]